MMMPCVCACFTWFLSSWNVAGAFARPRGITFYLKTSPFGATNVNKSLALFVSLTCQNQLRLSSLLLY